MSLSIKEAAELLGKTRRQVAYMIDQGELPAKKSGGRWVIERDDLNVDESRQQHVRQKRAKFKAVIEETVIPGKQPYTVRDLKAVQLAMPIYRQLIERGADGEKAALHMRECLDQLGIGCYRYDRQEKTLAYRAARDAASRAVIELLLSQGADTSEPLLDTIERELMPAMAGLLRRSERARP